MTNVLILTGKLMSDWETLANKTTGKEFHKNTLRGTCKQAAADGASYDRDWAIELIAFSHTGNSLKKHTAKGDTITAICQLQSRERESQDGTKTFLNHSASVNSYELLIKAMREAPEPAPQPGDNPDYQSIPFALLLSTILSFGLLVL